MALRRSTPSTVRNLLGYTATTATTSTPTCAGTPLGRCAACPGTPGAAADTQCVSNLNVSGLLTFQNEQGATLTLTGTGRSAATKKYEAALCVEAGARVAGVSEHGELRVGGPSCMGGPLSVSDVYGPVAFSNGTGAGGPTVTVIDGIETDTLQAILVDSGTVTAENVLTVQGYDASPLAGAHALAALQGAVVAVYNGGSTTSGVVLANIDIASGTPPYAVFTSAIANFATGALHVVGDVVSIITHDTHAAYAASVVLVCPALSLAVIVADAAAGFTPSGAILEVAGEEDDTPPAGTPVFLPRNTSELGGAPGFVSGVVSNASVSLFDTMTSVVLSVGSGVGALGNSDMGAPVLVVAADVPSGTPKVKLLTLLQHGCTDAATAYGPFSAALASCAGGLRSRYIKYVRNNVFNVALVTPLPVPVAVDGGGAPVQARGITYAERATVAGLVPGGVWNITDAIQAVTVYDSSDVATNTAVGVLASNTPSVTDVVLALAQANTSITDVVVVPNGTPTTDTTCAVGTDDDVFSHLTPANNFAAQLDQATILLPAKIPGAFGTGDVLALSSLSFQFSVPATLSLACVAVVQLGYQGCLPYINNVFALLGAYKAVDDYITGLGGALNAQWVADAATPPPPASPSQPVMVLAGTQSAGAVAFGGGVRYALLPTGGPIVITYDSATSTAAIGGGYTLTGIVSNSPINTFSYYQTPTGTGALAPGTSTVSVVVANAAVGSTTYTVDAAYTGVPLPLYP